MAKLVFNDLEEGLRKRDLFLILKALRVQQIENDLKANMGWPEPQRGTYQTLRQMYDDLIEMFRRAYEQTPDND